MAIIYNYIRYAVSEEKQSFYHARLGTHRPQKRWQKERERAAFSIQGVIGMCFLPETRGLTSPETVPRATPFK